MYSISLHTRIHISMCLVTLCTQNLFEPSIGICSESVLIKLHARVCYICTYGKGVLVVVYGYVCTILYTVILNVHKSGLNAPHGYCTIPTVTDVA